MRKRIVSILLCLILAITLAPGFEASTDKQISLSASAETAKPGDKITLTVQIPKIEEFSATFECRFFFDASKAECTEFAIPEIAGAHSFSNSADEANESGTIYFTYEADSLENDIDLSEGLAVDVVFRIRDGAAGSCDFNLDEDHANAYAFNEETYECDDLLADPTVTLTRVSLGSTASSGTTEPAEPEEPAKITFTDTVGHWGESYIEKAAQMKLFKGYPDGRFGPDDLVTRAQFVTTLYRYYGSQGVSGESPFEDIGTQSEEFQNAINWAYAKGYINGISETEFAPNKPVERQQAVKILYAINGGISGTEIMLYSVYDATFTDSGEIASWAKAPMYWAVYNELLSGATADTLAPQAYATRAQLAKILVSFLKG